MLSPISPGRVGNDSALTLIMKSLTLSELPHWPRLMKRPVAAAYLGISPNTFDRHVDVDPLPLQNGNVVYDKKDLDAFVDSRKSNNGSEWDEG